MQKVKRVKGLGRREKKGGREEECNSLPKREMSKEGCVSLVKGMFP